MAKLIRKRALGLDIGQASAKGVMLEQNGKSPHLVSAEVLDYRSEGILSETELCGQLAPWLDTCGWRNVEVTIGIPQYLATTQATDFPPGSERNLDEMVAFETQHLAGLSEEAFVYDHERLPPRLGRQNPVLIGICRESVVREKTEELLDNDIFVSDVTISGTALAGAYLHLYSEFAAAEAPQLVIEIGAENTTLLVVAGSQVLFASSLMFGVERYVQLVAQNLGIPAGEAHRDIMATPLNPADRASAHSKAARSLAVELEGAVDNWRVQEQTNIGNMQFARVCVCGGGARINGIDTFFGNAFDCPASIIGVSRSGQGAPDPLIMTAYGLALQGIGASPLSISLAPPDIRWHRQRRRQFGFLAVAALLLALLVVLFEIYTYRSLGSRSHVLSQRMQLVQEAQKLVPELEGTLREIGFRQRTLIPIVAKGNHAHRFLHAIRELGEARTEAITGNRGAKGWLVYLADENSFQAGKVSDADEPRTAPTIRRPGFRPGAADPQRAGETDVVRMRTIAVADVQPLQRMIATLYTTADPGEPFRHVRNFIHVLNPPKEATEHAVVGNLFRDVDILGERDIAGRQDIYQPWVDYLAAADVGTYRRFALELPFRTLDVKLNQGEQRQ